LKLVKTKSNLKNDKLVFKIKRF